MKGAVIRTLAIVVLSLMFLFQVPPSSSGIDEAPPPVSPETGPVLWTHLGPMNINDLEQVFSMDDDENTQYWIVQFRGPLTQEREDVLKASKMRVLDYFPDHGTVVQLNGFHGNDLEKIPGVYGASPFYSGLKVHPDILDQLREGDDPFEGFNSITIETFTDEPIIDQLSRYSHLRTSSTRYLVSLPVDPYHLMSIDGIKWIEPRSEMEFKNNIAAGIIDVDWAWDNLGLDGSGQTVGISDSGLDTGVDSPSVNGDIHLDFDNRATIVDWSGSGPDDENGHGTHVTGSVAGSGARSDGNIRGMAYNSSIYFQALMTDGGWLNTPSNLSNLFTQAYNNGARVHTNSWGTQSSALWGAYTAESYDVDWSMFYYPDMLILFAAGNDGNDANSDGKIDLNSVSPPSTSKSTLTVGASENLRGSGGYQGTWGMGWPADFPVNPISGDRPSNNSRGIAAFSSRGPLDDGRLKPDIVAPGTNILSTKSSQTSNTGWGPFNSTYVYYGGTSMSTPITAGMAALVRQFYNQTMGVDSPSAALVKATIINGATDISPGQFGAANPTTQEVDRRPDMAQGWGRIDLRDSVDPEGKTLSFIDNSSGISTATNLTRTFRVLSSDEELRLTLAWSDYPGSLFAGKQLINDLDLLLYAPNGSVYHGNDFSNPFDDATDSINPVEGISIKNPSTGWWRVVVKGSNIPRGPQHYSLVATGNMTEMISNTIMLDRRYYSTDDGVVSVSLTSRDLSGSGSISVFINSTSDPAGKNISLMEQGTFGSFMGSFITVNTSTTSPGELFVSEDDLIQVEYLGLPGFQFRANATAKRPVKVDLIKLPENHLTYSRYDDLTLKGTGDPGLEVYWTIPGSNLPWIGIYDDGHTTHGDDAPNDGSYSVVFYLSNNYNADGNILLRVEDPYLGPLYYEQFPLTINTSVPGAPKDLEAVPVRTGNTVLLKWTRSPSLGIHHHLVYINSTPDPPNLDISNWKLYKTTTGPDNITSVTGLLDGTQYHFRVGAVFVTGNESSPSLWASAIPYDDTPPTVTYDEPPMVFSGVADISFTADADTEKIELQYYNDTNGDGIANDNNTFLKAVNSTGPIVNWDTRDVGDIPKIILRWRGEDEVPNLSNWTYMSGFGIDNTPPMFLTLYTFPPRVTNGTNFNIIGSTEPLARVTIFLNGVNMGEQTAGMTGMFDLNIDLIEGANTLDLIAYDLYGAGPIYSNYTFARDTQRPVAVIREFNRTFELRCNCTDLVSDSFDRGLDPEMSVISNHTWLLIGPFGASYRYYSRVFDHQFVLTGDYTLELTVRDMAMNKNSTSITFQVIDRTSPVANISGPRMVNEDTTYGYSIEGSTDNDPILFRDNNAIVRWQVTGPGGFEDTSFKYDPSFLFPDPGIYTIVLTLEDSGGNSDMETAEVKVLDITPPSEITIIGDSVFDPGDQVNYTVEFRDNDPDHKEDSTFRWEMTFIDEGILLATFDTRDFNFTFTRHGNYSLKLTVTDPAGNSRNSSKQILVRQERAIIETPDVEEEDDPYFFYYVLGAVVVLVVILIIVIALAARRREYDDVESEWEDEEDLDIYDEIDDEEEDLDWDDEEDEWEMEW